MREKVLARRREDVDDLGVLGEPRLVLDAARDHAEVTGAARPLFVAEAKLHRPLDHPEELLVRVLMGGRVDARLHRPPDDHLVVADEDPSRDLVRDFLFGQVLERVVALHARHRTTSSRLGAPPLTEERPPVKRARARLGAPREEAIWPGSRSASSPSKGASTTRKRSTRSPGPKSSASIPCGWKSTTRWRTTTGPRR